MLRVLPDFVIELEDKLDKVIKDLAVKNHIDIFAVEDSMSIENGKQMISQALVRLYDNYGVEDRMRFEKADEEMKKWFKKDNEENEKNKDKWIKETLKKLPFVKWDRYIKDKIDNLIEVYGWIERKKDSYKDFVLLEFDLTKHKVYFVATSSDKYSKEIAEILDSPHSDCIKIKEIIK